MPERNALAPASASSRDLSPTSSVSKDAKQEPLSNIRELISRGQVKEKKSGENI